MIYKIFAKIFSKSSAADLVYVAKGKYNLKNKNLKHFRKYEIATFEQFLLFSH